MTIKKENGYIIISEIISDGINNRLRVEKYLYYTKAQAIKMYKQKYKY